MASQMTIWERGVVQEYAPAPGLESLMVKRIARYKRPPTKPQLLARFRRYGEENVGRALWCLLIEGHIAVTDGVFWLRKQGRSSL